MVIRILVAAALATGVTASPLASAAYGDPRKGCATGDSAIPPTCSVRPLP